MPRNNTGLEVFRKLDSLLIFRQAGAIQTTTTGAITAAQATFATAAMTGFTANDAVMIFGSNGVELNAVTALTPTSAVPLLYPALVPQASGAIVQRATSANLAHISDRGVVPSANFPLAAIMSALAATPIGYIPQAGEMSVSFDLLGMNGLNLQTVFGIPESEAGTGSSAAPYGVAMYGSIIGSQTPLCIRASGTRADGSTVIFDFCGAQIAPNGDLFALQRQNPSVLPCVASFQTLVYRQYS